MAFKVRSARISAGGAASRYTKQALAAGTAVVPRGLQHSRGLLCLALHMRLF